MAFHDSLRVAGSALSAQRLRLDVISNNLANAQTTRTESGEAFQRQQVVFRPIFEQSLRNHMSLHRSDDGHLRLGPTANGRGGVQVVQVQSDPRPGKSVYEPNHPDADESGYVMYPNVNVIEEMADMMVAQRAYEANTTAIQTVKAMALKALEIGRA